MPPHERVGTQEMTTAPAPAVATSLPPELLALTALERPHALASACQDVDWELLVAVARRHRLLGQLWSAIDAAGLTHRVPVHEREAMATEWRRRGRWFSTLVLPQLAEVCHALGTEGVNPVLLKGTALVCSGIVPAAGRPMSDIDVLVPREDVATASEVLLGLGYASRVSADERAWARRHHYQDPAWYHPDRPLAVEIHWDLMTRRNRLVFDHHSLGRTELVLPDGQRVSRLDAPAQLTHLVLHFWRDRRAGGPAALGQLWDIHRARRTLSAQEWTDLRVSAEQRGHLQVLAAVLACDDVLIGGDATNRWPEVEILCRNQRLHAFARRRVASPRPTAIQLLMVTESVDYAPWRVATRLLAQFRRPQRALQVLYGPSPAWRSRLRHVATIIRLLVPLLRSPLATRTELSLDRWAHRLR